jgi:hypothetical protein
MKKLAFTLAALACGLMPTGAAFAQSDDSALDTRDSPAGVRCSALGELPEADRAAAVYYLAGYNDGERDAMTFATVGTGAEVAAEPATDSAGQPAAGEAQPQQQEAPPADQTEGGNAAAVDAPAVGAEAAPMLPTVAVDAIIAACAQSPDSRVVDIITAQGTTE